MEGIAAYPVSIHRRALTVFFAGAFTDFFEAFLAAVFLAADFLAAVFLAAFFAGAFLAALFATAFLAILFGASFAGVSTLVTVVTAAPTAVCTVPATSLPSQGRIPPSPQPSPLSSSQPFSDPSVLTFERRYEL
jgi:hypothetical protein